MRVGRCDDDVRLRLTGTTLRSMVARKLTTRTQQSIRSLLRVVWSVGDQIGATTATVPHRTRHLTAQLKTTKKQRETKRNTTKETIKTDNDNDHI